MSSAPDWVHHNLRTGRVVIRRAPHRRAEPHDVVVVVQASPHVSAAGRARVVARGVRSVHATLRGRAVVIDFPVDTRGLRKVTYHPHRSAVFHYADTGEEWTGGDVLVTGGYAYEIDE